MISYEGYRILHLAFLMVLFTGLAISFYGGQSRLIKVLTGIATLLSLVTGMGLMARLGISQTGNWPFWIQLKLGVWFVVGVGGAMVTKRFPRFGRPAYFVSLVLFVLAATAAIMKF